MRVLVIGGDGLIGRQLVQDLRASGSDVSSTSRRLPGDTGDRIALDLATTNIDHIQLPDVDVAFFCAAMSTFASCEADPTTARRVNVEAPFAMAARLVSRGSQVVLLSTAAVFNGQVPKVRADQPCSARTVYGNLKAEAESSFLALGNRSSALRLTKVLHPGMPIFKHWIEILAAGGSVSAFSDLALAPISLKQAVEALIGVAKDRSGGIYQASARNDISYADAARHVARRLGASEDRVIAVSGAEAGLPPEQVVPFASLDTSRLDSLTGRDAPEALDVIDGAFLSAIERARWAGLTPR